MPSKKKKYNARFPPARIKKIMQRDEEVGKVAAPVPVIISRALELFVESLIRQGSEVTLQKNARTLTTSHLKQCILAETKFDFLKDLVASVPDFQGEDESGNGLPATPTTPLPSAEPFAVVQRLPFRNGRGGPRASKRRAAAAAGPSRQGQGQDTDGDTAASSSSDTDSCEEDDEESPVGETVLAAGTSVHHPHIVYGGSLGAAQNLLAPPQTVSSPGLDEDYDT